jgi:hypothetical protein
MVSGCISTPVVISNFVPQGAHLKSAHGAAICLLVPQDASFENEQYPGSGDEIAGYIKDALHELGRTFRTVRGQLEGIKPACKDVDAGLALETQILHYEDRITGWSGRPDRIELKLVLFDVEHPSQKRSIYYEAKSNLLVSGLLEWGNARPSSLLGDDFSHAIRKLLAQ